jgi:hypothetical protein
MIHEAQHSIPIVGAANRVTDLKLNGKRAYSLSRSVIGDVHYSNALVETLPTLPSVQQLSDSNKPLNAQNYAFFAILVSLLR